MAEAIVFVLCEQFNSIQFNSSFFILNCILTLDIQHTCGVRRIFRWYTIWWNLLTYWDHVKPNCSISPISDMTNILDVYVQHDYPMTKTLFMLESSVQKCVIFTWLPWCFLQVMGQKQELMHMQKSHISQLSASLEPGKQLDSGIMLPRSWWCTLLGNVQFPHRHRILLYDLPLSVIFHGLNVAWQQFQCVDSPWGRPSNMK